MPRLALFTDTLTDINGVARFVSSLAAHGPDLHILTSTRRPTPAAPNIHALAPLLAAPLPAYPQLDLSVPSPRALSARAASLAPDLVHISTPGPVGLLGRRFALRHHLPLVGTYHTDFPAYIDHLLADDALTALARAAIRRFYAPFHRILIRSPAIAPRLSALGIPADRIAALIPGIDTTNFHPRHRDPHLWHTIPHARPAALKLLYVGRVSVEKNLPMLARIWPRLRAAALAHSPRIDTQLIVVGDGPYRPAMQRALPAPDTLFLGFRHGSELARLYASSDLFLFPSHTDTLGQAVMEAQASGLPAIVTTTGGPATIIRHAHTGLAAPSDDAFARAALALMTSPTTRAAMSGAARDHLAPMTIARSIDHFLALHTDLLQKHKPGHTLACGPARR